MSRILLVAAAWIVLPIGASLFAADDDRPAAFPGDLQPLEGAWVAESMDADGEAAPAEAVKWMRFTFQGEDLLVRGNSSDDREQKCSFVLDPKASPARLDFTLEKKEKAVLAIYKRRDDQLTVALRKVEDARGRPEEFESKKGSGVLLIVFKKQAAPLKPKP